RPGVIVVFVVQLAVAAAGGEHVQVAARTAGGSGMGDGPDGRLVKLLRPSRPAAQVGGGVLERVLDLAGAVHSECVHPSGGILIDPPVRPGRGARCRSETIRWEERKQLYQTAWGWLSICRGNVQIVYPTKPTAACVTRGCTDPGVGRTSAVVIQIEGTSE